MRAAVTYDDVYMVLAMRAHVGKVPRVPRMSAGDLSPGNLLGKEEAVREEEVAVLGALLLDLQGLKGELPRIMPGG